MHTNPRSDKGSRLRHKFCRLSSRVWAHQLVRGWRFDDKEAARKGRPFFVAMQADLAAAFARGGWFGHNDSVAQLE